MVVGYSDVIDGCTDGSVDKEDALKIELKDYGEIQGVPQDGNRGDNAIPTKILDICRRTTADKDKVVETSVEVVSSSDESTAECYSSSDEDSNALDTVGKDNNNSQIRMTNEITECKDFWVAKTVNITNNYEYDKQLLDVQQLKSLTDGSPPKALWSDSLFPDESAERANAKVSHRLCKALAVVLSTVTLVLVVVIVVVEIWQLKKPEGISDNDNQCENLPSTFGMRLVDREGWSAKTAKYLLKTLKNLPLNTVNIEVIPELTCSTRIDCQNLVFQLQAVAMRKGQFDLPSNFVLPGDGFIYEGRGWNRQGENFEANESYYLQILGDDSDSSCRNSSLSLLLDEGVRIGKLTTNYTVYTTINKELLENKASTTTSNPIPINRYGEFLIKLRANSKTFKPVRTSKHQGTKKKYKKSNAKKSNKKKH
uniref:Peptidoglycan recognition protein family domain-containing protein n=2 Tax=Lygus hesperus TaxID=30085 RepID=A0A0K8SS17_LYGHE